MSRPVSNTPDDRRVRRRGVFVSEGAHDRAARDEPRSD
jgi:hypothetical protein